MVWRIDAYLEEIVSVCGARGGQLTVEHWGQTGDARLLEITGVERPEHLLVEGRDGTVGDALGDPPLRLLVASPGDEHGQQADDDDCHDGAGGPHPPEATEIPGR